MPDVLTQERWERVKSVFHGALELDSSRQQSYLEVACGDDLLVRREVERLIEHHVEGASYLDHALSVTARLARTISLQDHVFQPGCSVNGRFRIVRFIGAGGMGEVYEAIDEAVGGVRVALKTLRAAMAMDEELQARFRREVQIARRITHPNACRIHDLFDTYLEHPHPHRVVFLTMELLEGESLAQHLERIGRMPLQEALPLLRDIGGALEAAHREGVIHRDLKSSNVMLVVGRDGSQKAVLTDFGLACQERWNGAGEGVTRVEGTPEYMAPEQLEGGEIGFPADIFALGVVIYEMVTGHRPYDVGSTVTGAARRSRSDPIPPRSYVPDLQPRWEGVILRCLARNPAERFQKASEVLAALESPRPRTVITRRAALASGIAGAGGVLYWIWAGRQDEGPLTARISSIAVLPFDYPQGESDLQYLAEGLTSDLLPMLTRFRGLKVLCPTRAQLKGLSGLQSIGKRFNVATALTGTVRKQGGRIEVVAQLTNVADGVWLWSGTYDEEARMLRRIRLNLSLAIAGALQPRLPAVQLAGMAGPQSQNAEAYNLYLVGRHYASYRTDDGLKRSAEFLQRSIGLDPKFAPAYAALSDVYSILAGLGGCPPSEYLPKAEEAAQQALAIDPQSADAHSSLGFNDARYRWNWAASEQQFREAIRLAPGSVQAHYRYAGLHSNLGRHDLALREVLIARELDPLSAVVNAGYGAFLYRARRYDDAIGQLQNTLQTFPDFAAAFSDLGQVYDTTGRMAEAIAAHRKAVDSGAYYFRYAARLGHALARAGNRPEALKIAAELEAGLGTAHYSPMSIANLYTGLGDIERTFYWYDIALRQHDPNMAVVKIDPVNDPLRGDPRFTKLLEQLKL